MRAYIRIINHAGLAPWKSRTSEVADLIANGDDRAGERRADRRHVKRLEKNRLRGKFIHDSKRYGDKNRGVTWRGYQNHLDETLGRDR